MKANAKEASVKASAIDLSSTHSKPDRASMPRADPASKEGDEGAAQHRDETRSHTAPTGPTVSKDEAEAIFQVNSGQEAKRIVIFVPASFPDRRLIVEKIVRYGGQVTVKPSQADVALIHEDESMNELVKRVSRTAKSAGIVTKKWLDDSIARGEMQSRYDLYTPVFDDTLTKKSESEKLPEIRPAPQTYRRVNRKLYTATDEENIVQMLAVLQKTFNLTSISKSLASLFPSHPAGSYYRQMSDNMTTGKNYELRVEQFRQKEGKEGLERILKRFELGVHASPSRAAEERRGEDVAPSDSPSQALDSQGRADAVVQADIQDTPSRRDASVDTNDRQANSQQERVTQGTQTPEVSRRITPKHADHLIEKLSLWLKSKFQPSSSSSQSGSVIGYIEGSQESIQPPEQLFIEMSLELNSHTAQEWRCHFEKQNNRETYLELAKERLENSLGAFDEDDDDSDEQDGESGERDQEEGSDSAHSSPRSSSRESELEKQETEAQISSFHLSPSSSSSSEAAEQEEVVKQMDSQSQEVLVPPPMGTSESELSSLGAEEVHAAAESDQVAQNYDAEEEEELDELESSTDAEPEHLESERGQRSDSVESIASSSYDSDQPLALRQRAATTSIAARLVMEEEEDEEEEESLVEITRRRRKERGPYLIIRCDAESPYQMLLKCQAEVEKMQREARQRIVRLERLERDAKLIELACQRRRKARRLEKSREAVLANASDEEEEVMEEAQWPRKRRLVSSEKKSRGAADGDGREVREQVGRRAGKRKERPRSEESEDIDAQRKRRKRESIARRREQQHQGSVSKKREESSQDEYRQWRPTTDERIMRIMLGLDDG